MAREFPIHNGRMTTDLDANGHRIVNLPGGGTDTISWENVTDKPSFATVATSGSYNDLTDKPTIPAPVDISGKMDGDQVYGLWDGTAYYDSGDVVFWDGNAWIAIERIEPDGTEYYEPGKSRVWIRYSNNLHSLILGKQDALSSAQIGYINDVPNKANAADVATALAQKASMSDLPYALVTPGEWTFSGLPGGVTVSSLRWDNYVWILTLSDQTEYTASSASEDETEIYFYGGDDVIVATKTGIHLLDRAVNAVSVTDTTTLTLPAAVPGYLRDFLVRLAISGSTVPTITFSAPTGETLTYETDGDEFPVPDAEGTWLYSFTETAAHTFAVAIKSVSVVTQGGV